MKHKVLKSAVAALACAAMMGTTCFATELTVDNLAAGSTIEGSADVINPIYKIVVPTELKFSVDPFEQKEQSQIYSPEYNVINKSNVAVKVDTAVTLTAKEGIEIVSTEAAVKETNTDKIAYVAVEIPSAVAETADQVAQSFTPVINKVTASTATGIEVDDYVEASQVASLSGVTAADEYQGLIDTTAVAGTYTSSAKAPLADKTAVNCLFALQAADYVDYYTVDGGSTVKKSLFANVAATQAGTTTFRFYGKVNSKAAWANEDLSASITFKFLGLSSTNYTELMEKQVVIEGETKAHAYVTEGAAPVFASTEVGKITYTTGSGDSALKKIDKINAVYSGTTYDLYNAFGSSWTAATDDGAGTITLQAAAYSAWANATDNNPDVTIEYTSEDGTSHEVTIQLTTYTTV